MKRIRIYETGGPEVLRFEEGDMPSPQQGEVLIKVAAVGVNYADLMQRQGMYLSPTRPPLTLGSEFAGTIVETGPGVQHLTKGMRVVALGQEGYAEYALASASATIPLPDSLDFTHAAAVPLQGITAYQLLYDEARLQPGERVLIHAAAGGVGTLAVQLAKHMGAGSVIGTASSTQKLDLARRLGADVTINYTDPNWVEQVLQATGGQGPDVILEMVGGKIAEQSLECLARFGRMIVYGAASGQPMTFSGTRLMQKNQTVAGYWLALQLRRPERIAKAITELLQLLAAGKLEIIVGQTFPLSEAAAAHQALSERGTTGKVVLLP